MLIFARGEAQKFVESFEPAVSIPFGQVVGVCDLGKNNGSHNFGWCGVKAVVDINGERYVLDFPEETRLTTNSGDPLTADTTEHGWWPSLEDYKEYGLELFDRNGLRV